MGLADRRAVLGGVAFVLTTLAASALPASAATEDFVWADRTSTLVTLTPMWFDPPSRHVRGFTASGLLVEWDGATWNKRLVAPLPKLGPYAYDSARARLVMLAGNQETWEWDGGAWLPGMTGPLLFGHALAYDAAAKRIVAFGSPNSTSASETWTYDGSTWAKHATATAPSTRVDVGMVGDDARGVVVLFGGGGCTTPQCATVLGDTWTWDGSTWTQHTTPTSPSPRETSLVYDAARKKVVLFSGIADTGAGGGLARDTWEWDGSAWTERHPTGGPAPRGRPNLAYDAAERRVLLAGGGTATLGTESDTWVYWSFAGTCASSDACDTSRCDQGVCCAVECGRCERCDDTGKGCALVTNGDDADSCTGTQTCDPGGECRAKGGQACAQAADCASSECEHSVCCGTRCAPFACTPDGACRARCDGDMDCAAGASCAEERCVVAAGTCPSAHVARSSVGVEQDCTPFSCDGRTGSCRTTCASSDDCVVGFACDHSGSCTSAPPAGVGGCHELPHDPAEGPSGWLLVGGLGAAVTVVRRARSARRNQAHRRSR